MAIVFLSLVVFLFLFGTVFLSDLVQYITHAKKLDHGPWDLPLAARRRRIPKVYVMESPGFETLIVTNAWTIRAFISRNLWERWSISEKTAFLYWCLSVRLTSSNLGRILWGFNIQIADRNAALDSDDKLAIVGALEKAALERTQLRPGPFLGILSGLSLMGPSILQKWASVDERLKHLTFHLSKLEKAR